MWYGLMLLASLYVGTSSVGVPIGNPVIASDSTFAHVLPAVVTADAARVRTSPPRTDPAATTYATSWSSRFEYARHGIFVRVALDGVDAGWFLLDTGANATVIDTRIALDRRLEAIGDDTIEGTAGTARATIYELGNVSVNGATAIAVTGVAQDLSGFPSPDGRRLSGILGSDFLGAFAVRIDFATHEVTFSATADSATSNRALVHFDVDHGAPRIPVTLDGSVATEFRIDTGLHGAYDEAPYLAVTDDVWRGIARTRSARITDGEVRVRGLGDGDVVRPAVRIDRLTIGGARVDAPWVVPQAPRGYFARPDAVSLLGNGVLERFTPITIDYLTGTLYLTIPK